LGGWLNEVDLYYPVCYNQGWILRLVGGQLRVFGQTSHPRFERVISYRSKPLLVKQSAGEVCPFSPLRQKRKPFSGKKAA
ncbi:MAG: hypothetical protein AB2404_13155, partial [Planifilum fimeticola]